MGLDRDTYSVTIPLGATINMDGAAITITVMTLAAANTLGITVDIPSAILLSILAAVLPVVHSCLYQWLAHYSVFLMMLQCRLSESASSSVLFRILLKLHLTHHLTFYFLLLLSSDSGEKKAGKLLINMTNEKMSGMLHYCGTPDIFNNYWFLYLFLIMLTTARTAFIRHHTDQITKSL